MSTIREVISEINRERARQDGHPALRPTTPVSEHKVSPEMRTLVDDLLSTVSVGHLTHPRHESAVASLLAAMASLESQLGEARRDTERLRPVAEAARRAREKRDAVKLSIAEKDRAMDAVTARAEYSMSLEEIFVALTAADSARGAPHD